MQVAKKVLSDDVLEEHGQNADQLRYQVSTENAKKDRIDVGKGGEPTSRSVGAKQVHRYGKRWGMNSPRCPL